MLVAVDIGNTSIAVGVFDGQEIRASFRLKTDVDRHPDEYAVILLSLFERSGLPLSAIEGTILASVVPSLTPTLEDVCRRYFHSSPMIVGTGVRTGIRINYDNPRDVGADRIVDAVAALKLYGPPPLVVVDFGTATVFDAISAEGEYLGGAISPGIMISAEALFQRTAKLPRIELERPKTAIGKNTVHAMQSGIVFGYVGLIEGIVARFKRELGGEARVIATGGWAQAIARETSVVDVVDADLTLQGLRMLFDMNHGDGG